MGILQKTEAVSSNQDENKSACLKNEIFKKNEQKITMYVINIIVDLSQKYGFP